MQFQRYAVYYAPPASADWARLATRWLGWDMVTGDVPSAPDGPLDRAALTERPRRYGLHATLKPPFRLADGETVDRLADACAGLAGTLAPVALDGLAVTRLGGFLALCPEMQSTALTTLAAACVRELDAFRAPSSKAELTRRRASRLTERQEANLKAWGYPHVMDAFRFHITLTGHVHRTQVEEVRTVLTDLLQPHLPRHVLIRDLALVGEAVDGRFHLIRRYTLSR